MSLSPERLSDSGRETHIHDPLALRVRVRLKSRHHRLRLPHTGFPLSLRLL